MLREAEGSLRVQCEQRSLTFSILCWRSRLSCASAGPYMKQGVRKLQRIDHIVEGCTSTTLKSALGCEDKIVARWAFHHSPVLNEENYGLRATRAQVHNIVSVLHVKSNVKLRSRDNTFNRALSEDKMVDP